MRKRGRLAVMGLAVLLGVTGLQVRAEGEPENLYAKAAVLMDADSGRVLFEKNGEEVLPMASTTKIMTLLVTLENADLEGVVEVSGYAASMPDVQLNIREGERYRLLDLCYSLMLESHNDSAVAIAEHVGGSVEGFAAMMNQRARDLGCYNTHFVTPNGLDAEDEGGVHATTATDLARIMRCCMENGKFLTITQAASWTFSDLEGKRTFTVNNKNAFLTMMEGALTGKTGFTGNAGYCYVGALERDGKRLVVALLACGWPNNRTWKWKDTMRLMEYGLSTFEKQTVGQENMALEELPVAEGQESSVPLTVRLGTEELLMRDGDSFRIEVRMEDGLTAPVERGTIVGAVVYYLNDEIRNLFPICTDGEVKAVDYPWCLERVFEQYIPR